MTFTVVWLPGSEDRLAQHWLIAADRNLVTEAANWIDRTLRKNPLNHVTSVDTSYFIRRDPLLVLCDIDVDDRMVRIIDVQLLEGE